MKFSEDIVSILNTTLQEDYKEVFLGKGEENLYHLHLYKDETSKLRPTSIGIGELFIRILATQVKQGAGSLFVPEATTGDNQAYVWNFFRRLNFTPESIAGIMGNLMQESGEGINPKSSQLGGGPGRGIMQWTVNQRWAELVRWAKKRGLDEWALQTQLEYIVIELNKYRIYDTMRSFKDIEDATYFFERKMERAGKPNMPRRIRYAQQVYGRFYRR
jgi:hypothetical protein